MANPSLVFGGLLGAMVWEGFAQNAQAPKFEVVEVDSKVQIGYGVAVADVDGDKRPDILLADKSQIAWYRNPAWTKCILAENLTQADNVCLAAADIDGDGKAEVAVGAGWNPSDTTGSGAVFYLVPPADRTQRWKPIQLHHEPTVHRMRWIRTQSQSFALAVLPLHGRGNKNGEGQGVRFFSYTPLQQPGAAWQTSLMDDSLHLAHNFDLVKWARGDRDELLVASKEGLIHLVPDGEKWIRRELAGVALGTTGFQGAGEIRSGLLADGKRFLATVEPMHGNQVVIYTEAEPHHSLPTWKRQVIDATIREGHALATGDLLKLGCDQLVMGWRAPDTNRVTGIKLFVPDQQGDWTATVLDDKIACEDLCLADLNADGRLDIIASGRATRNLKIYLNKN